MSVTPIETDLFEALVRNADLEKKLQQKTRSGSPAKKKMAAPKEARAATKK